MRVGLIIYGSLQTVSGGYLYDRKLAEYSRETGDDVQIISLPWRNQFGHLLQNFSSNTIQKIKELKLDVLLEDELNHPSLIVLNRSLADNREFPILSIVHHLQMKENMETGRAMRCWIEKAYLRGVDGYIFNSQTTAASVNSLVPGKPAVIAYPGKDRFVPEITEQEIAVRSQREGPLRIVFLGNIIPRKGLDMLIRSLKPLPRATWRMTVIGSMDRNKTHSRSILQLVRSNGLEKNISFTGQIPDAAVAEFLRNHHVLAVPSHYEGYGIVYVEAMGFGLPVIGTGAGGACEIIEHDVNGLLINPEDIPKLTGYLRRLNEDRDLLYRMSTNALRKYGEFPTWRETCGKIRNFLCTMISGMSKEKKNISSWMRA